MKRKLLAGIILNFMITSIIIGLCWWWEIPLFFPIGFILVLLIHEVGHLLTMKYLGYMDLELYMVLPFFAMVGGKKENTRTSESIMVVMAGPLPGILIGSILAPLGSILDSDVITFLAIMFLFINTINLLPIFPLDGGQVLVSIFRLDRNQLLFVILVSLAVTISAMIMFRLFELIILIAIQVYWFIDLRSEKEYNADHFYDLSKFKLALALLGYFIFLSLAIASLAFWSYTF